MSAFRQHFVKPGLIEVEFSDIYGLVMDHRHISDYELELTIGNQQAEADLLNATRFVERIAYWLKREGWL